MKRTPRLHYDAGPVDGLEGRGARAVPCPQPYMPASRVTDEPAAVTCRRCRAWLAAQEPTPAEPFTPGAPVEVHAQEWDDRGPAIVYRSIAGDDGSELDGWRTLDAAFRAWHAVSVGSLVPSSSAERSGGGGSGDHTPGSIACRARVLPVEIAIVAACSAGVTFAGAADGRGSLYLAPGTCRTIVEAYVIDRWSAEDIAARVATALHLGDDGVTAHQVALVWRGVRVAVRADLERRGLIARARAIHTPEVASSRRDKGDAMALPPGYDVETWRRIADATGLAESTCRKLAARAEDPLPVRDYLGAAVARRAELSAWALRQVKIRAAS